MASPLFDALSVQHSRNIGDYKSTAAGDGIAVTSAMRSNHLNRAIRTFIEKNVELNNYSPVSQYIASVTASLSSNVYALTTPTPKVAWIIGIANNTNVRTVKPLPQNMKPVVSEGADNAYLTASTTNQYYVREGVNVRVLGAGATDSITMRYVAIHTDLTAGFTSDILIDAQYWEVILSLALYYAMLERPSEENNVKAKIAYDNAMSAITGLAQSSAKGN